MQRPSHTTIWYLLRVFQEGAAAIPAIDAGLAIERVPDQRMAQSAAAAITFDFVCSRRNMNDFRALSRRFGCHRLNRLLSSFD